NRLASNSLLEAVVFGLRAGRAMSQSEASAHVAGAAGLPIRQPMLVPKITEREVRELTWEHCGIVRDRAGLEAAIERLDRTEWESCPSLTLASAELRNIHQVASLIAHCGLWRQES